MAEVRDGVLYDVTEDDLEDYNYTIAQGVTKVGDRAFKNCYDLEIAYIPESVTVIGERAFYDSGLEEVILPPGVTEIGLAAFSGTYIKTINIPEGVTEIKNYTFYGCLKLTEAYLPAGITSIGEHAFLGGCHELNDIYIKTNDMDEVERIRGLFGGASEVLRDKVKIAPVTYTKRGNREAEDKLFEEKDKGTSDSYAAILKGPVARDELDKSYATKHQTQPEKEKDLSSSAVESDKEIAHDVDDSEDTPSNPSPSQ